PGQSGNIVAPPLLSSKISVSSAANTNKWVFYGTRKQIIDWMREHPDLYLENKVFIGGKPASDVDGGLHTELVIDLQYLYDQQQTYKDYLKSFFVSIYDVERVKVELRPRLESKDGMINALNRIIISSGTQLKFITDDLEAEWFKPAQSYYQQTVHLFNDDAPATSVLGGKPPSTVRVGS
ncbi:hypothetical protein K501DRAFT_157875, partial [Backusella circina FSU 941]